LVDNKFPRSKRLIATDLFAIYYHSFYRTPEVLFSEKDLENAKKIIDKQMKIVFIGFGGGNSNFARWFYDLAKMLKKPI